MVCGVGEGERLDSVMGALEAPALADAAVWRALKVLASATRLEESITDVAPVKQESKG